MFLAVLAFTNVVGAPPSEPPGIQKAVREAAPALVEAALAAPELASCRPHLKGQDVLGLPCRLAVMQALAKATTPATVDAVKTRQAFVRDALLAAGYASETQALTPKPGLRRARLDAHRRGCAVAFEAVADLEVLTAKDVAHEAAREVLAGDGAPKVTLRARACQCAQRTVSLAVGADAPPDEQAALQSIVTSQRCLVGRGGDDLQATGPKGPDSLSGAGAGTKVDAAADAASPAGRLRALAEGRAVEFSRCTDKAMRGTAIVDEPKLTTCACNVIRRWALPFRADDPPVSAALPIGSGAIVDVSVKAGAVATCGPVRFAG